MAGPSLPSKVLIVVDPAQEEAVALNRALITAKMYAKTEGAELPSLHVFVAVDMDNVDTSKGNDKLRRDRAWFNSTILEPLENSGVDYNMELSWSTDWYGSIHKVAETTGAELIMLPVANKLSTSKMIFNDSIWRLLRTAPCPVLVVQPGAPESRQNVLTAVNVQSHKPAYQELNDKVIERGRWISDSYGAKMHVVNAYSDSLNYPDRSKLAVSTGVDTADIHVVSGDPSEVISRAAKKVDADIVVLGVRARSSRWRGNTLEKIITQVDCDIMAIHQD